MEEANMVEELKRLGYRVSKPRKTKPKEAFKPFTAIHKPLGGHVAAVTVIEEKMKTVRIKSQRGDVLKVSKSEIFEFSQVAIDKYDEMWKKTREIRNREAEMRQKAWESIHSILKPRYKEEKESESVGFGGGA